MSIQIFEHMFDMFDFFEKFLEGVEVVQNAAE